MNGIVDITAKSGLEGQCRAKLPCQSGEGLRGVRDVLRYRNVVRFDAYEVRLPTQELLKYGSRIKLSPQAFRVLQMLLDRPGELVAREEFHRALWPADTFVDFEHGLNNAVKKLRDALSDSAETPRYIETLPKLGYRFIGQSNGAPPSELAKGTLAETGNGNGNGNGHGPDARASVEVEPIIHRTIAESRDDVYRDGSDLQEYSLRFMGRSASSRWKWIGVVAALALMAGGGIVYWVLKGRSTSQPAIKQRILTDASSQTPVWDAAISPDGKYLVYTDNRKLYLKVLSTGEARDLPQPDGLDEGGWGRWSLGGWFPDSSRFLANMHGSRGVSIWLVSVLGTPARKLRDGAEAFAVSPDGASIAFGAGGIWLMDADGQHARLFLRAPNNRFMYADIQWSPDGKRVAYKLTHIAEPHHLPRVADPLSPPETSIRTLDLNGQSPTTILAETPFLDFRWMPDGRILFTRGGEEEDSTAFNLWELRVDNQTALPQGKPRQLTNWEGVGFDALSSTSDGKRLAYVRHSNAMSIYVSEFDKAGHSLNATRRLTTTQSWDFPFDWTEDGKAVIFMSHRRGHWNIYKQALGEDFPETLVSGKDGAEALAPRLSPDGKWVIYTEYSFDAQRQVSSDRIMRAPLSGGPSELILSSANNRGKSCSRAPANVCVVAELSDDGSQLTFSAFDPIGGRGSELAHILITPGMNCWWTFSPDGTRISYIEPGYTTIHVLPLDHGRPYEIHVEGWPGFTVVTASANADGYFVDSRMNGKIALLFVEPSGKAYPLVENGNDRNWAIPSRNGKLVATMDESADGNVWMVENF